MAPSLRRAPRHDLLTHREVRNRYQRSRAWADAKVTTHHGIIPTLELANLSAMSQKELAICRLIRSRYLM